MRLCAIELPALLCTLLEEMALSTPFFFPDATFFPVLVEAPVIYFFMFKYYIQEYKCFY